MCDTKTSPFQFNTKAALRKLALRELLNNLEKSLIFPFHANTSSVWINSTVKATNDNFSLDKQHCCRRISRPRSTFSLDKQHCIEADWLSIQSSVKKDFWILIGRGHLISLFDEVRCYRLLYSAHWHPNLILNFTELAALSSGSRTRRPRCVPSSAVIARSKKSAARPSRHQHISLPGWARPTSWHAPHITEWRS